VTVNSDLGKGFRLGAWTVVPEHGEISNGADTHRLEPKVMDVLQCLARHAGSLVTKQQLVDAVWQGRPVSDEVIARCISALRTHLGDDHRDPEYIETLPKRGYRLITPVQPVEADASRSPSAPPRRRRLGWRHVLAAVAAAAIIYTAWREFAPDVPAGSFESIAVLPFTNLSAEPDQYLADGVTEELTFALTQLPDLKVAARTSAFQFRDTALDVREIGREIGVDGIIEGSVRREGDDLRVTAQLVDAHTGYHLWAVTFDGSVSDVFRLQRRVAERVRDSIGARKPPRDLAVAEPADPAAYDLYLRGRYALNRRGAPSLEHAIGLFEESIALNPDYGPAYLQLANAYLLMPAYTAGQTDEMYESAVRTVDLGTRADPSIADAAAAVHGYIHYKRGKWLEADRAFQSALAGRHVDSTTHQWYSNMLAAVGRLNDALEQAQRAHKLDPLSPVVVSRLAVTELWTNDNAAAESHFAVASELGIRSPLHTEGHLLLLLRQRRLDEARQFSAALGGGTMPPWVGLLLDCVGESLECAEAAAALESATAVSPRVQLVAWSVLGDLARVTEVARRLETDIGAFDTELLFIAELEALRRDPEFERLMEALGIAEYWRNVGCTWSDAGVVCDGTRIVTDP
jgi:TolB-like protein/DNA-binding winged helix-turn-helix (wHTH) protein/Tfp pilus assembly protein PilF